MGCAGNNKNIPLGVASMRQSCETVALVFFIMAFFINIFSPVLRWRCSAALWAAMGIRKNIPLWAVLGIRKKHPPWFSQYKTAVLFFYLDNIIFSRPYLQGSQLFIWPVFAGKQTGRRRFRAVGVRWLEVPMLYYSK